MVIRDEQVTGGTRNGAVQGDYMSIQGCWDLKLASSHSSDFFPKSLHCPGNYPEKDKVLLINRGISTKYSPEQGFPVKSGISECGFIRGAPKKLLIHFSSTIERQSLQLSRIEKNRPDRGLGEAAPEASLAH